MSGKIYTGIGSRQVGDPYVPTMIESARLLGRSGWTLRSGGADGSDSYFESGCDQVGGTKEIYLPWSGFNSKQGIVLLDPSPEEAVKIARSAHPAWSRLSPAARKLHTRNVFQVLGFDLMTPSEFVLVYTQDGSGDGGSGQAIRIANAFGVPVLDLGLYKTEISLRVALAEFLAARGVIFAVEHAN